MICVNICICLVIGTLLSNLNTQPIKSIKITTHISTSSPLPLKRLYWDERIIGNHRFHPILQKSTALEHIHSQLASEVKCGVLNLEGFLERLHSERVGIVEGLAFRLEATQGHRLTNIIPRPLAQNHIIRQQHTINNARVHPQPRHGMNRMRRISHQRYPLCRIISRLQATQWER